MQKVEKVVLLTFVAVYRTIGTTFIGGSCRFSPSCSAYAVDAIHEYSPAQALKLILLRILKCRPGGGFGYDPLPPGPGRRSP